MDDRARAEYARWGRDLLISVVVVPAILAGLEMSPWAMAAGGVVTLLLLKLWEKKPRVGLACGVVLIASFGLLRGYMAWRDNVWPFHHTPSLAAAAYAPDLKVEFVLEAKGNDLSFHLLATNISKCPLRVRRFSYTSGKMFSAYLGTIPHDRIPIGQSIIIPGVPIGHPPLESPILSAAVQYSCDDNAGEMPFTGTYSFEVSADQSGQRIEPFKWDTVQGTLEIVTKQEASRRLSARMADPAGALVLMVQSGDKRALLGSENRWIAVDPQHGFALFGTRFPSGRAEVIRAPFPSQGGSSHFIAIHWDNSTELAELFVDGHKASDLQFFQP